jgi:hypothetical protein
MGVLRANMVCHSTTTDGIFAVLTKRLLLFVTVYCLLRCFFVGEHFAFI